MMSLPYVVSLLASYKYFLLFPIVVIEGPIITVIAGFLSSLGQLDFATAFAIVVAGDLMGDSAYYAFGYYGRERFIVRWGRFLGITAARVARLEQHFATHGGKTLVIGKFSHFVGAAVLVAAGMSRMSFGAFLWYNFLPTLPKSFILMLIGFYFGESYTRLNTYLDYTALGTLGIALVCVALYVWMRKTGKQYEAADEQAPR